MHDPLVNQLELARLLGVDPGTIRTWQRQGMPIEKASTRRGDPNQYSVPAVVRWREEQARLAASGDLNAMDMEEARRRKLAAEAATAELALDERRGVVVEVGVVMEEVGRGLDSCRARLLGIGSKLAPMIAIETDAAVCKRMVDDAVNEALHELSGPAFELPSGPAGDNSEGAEESSEGAVHAAADSKPQRVGRRKSRPVS